MDSFPGDYYGYRCHKGKKSSDIFNDYLDLLDDVLAYDEYGINWQLTMQQLKSLRILHVVFVGIR
jgi:hypothetical protein